MSALFALAAAIGWGSSDFAAGYASRKSPAVSVVILTHLAALVALLCFAVDLGPVWTMCGDVVASIEPGGRSGGIRWSGPGIAGSPSAADLGWGVAAGLGGGMGAMLLFRGLGKGSMAVVAPITAAGAATIPVLFGLLTGDAVTVLGIAGIALALVAIVLVSLGDGGTGSDDAEELTVPDEWSTQFRLPPLRVAADPRTAPVAAAPLAPPRPTAGPTALATLLPAPVGSPATPPSRSGSLHPRPSIETAPRAAIAGDATTTSEGVELPLRSIRYAVLALLAAAGLSASAIASHPIRSLLDGGEFTGPVAWTLAFALVIVGLAVFALHRTVALFEIVEAREGSGRDLVGGFAVRAGGLPLARLRLDPTRPPGAAAPPVVSWQAIVRQPGVTEALFSGLGFGLFFVFIYRASEAAGHWPLVGARLVSVVLFAAVALATATALLPERPSRAPVILAGLLDAGAAICFVLSTRVGLLSVGAVIAALYPVATVVLARVITKERIRRQQLVGLVVALVAVGLLAV